MTRRHALVVGTTLSVIAALLVACERERDPIQDTIRQLQNATVSAGGQITGMSPLERTGSSLEASWELVTELAWEEYRPSLARAMPAGFVSRASEERQRCTFVKSLPADHLAFEVEVLSGGSPLRLRSTFVAGAW